MCPFGPLQETLLLQLCRLDLACRRTIGKCVAAEHDAAAKKQLALRLAACRQEILASSRDGTLADWLAANHPGDICISPQISPQDATATARSSELGVELGEFEPLLLALEWQASRQMIHAL